MSNGGEVSVKFSAQGEQAVTGSAAKIDAALQRLAAKEIKLQTSSIDQLNDKLKKLDAALAKNRLTQEQHAAAVDRAKQEHQDKINAPAMRIQEQLDRAASAKLDGFANKIRSQVVTPLEEAQEEAVMLGLALERGLLTPAQHAAAMAKNVEKIKQATTDADGSVAQFAERVKSIQATPMDRLREKQELLNRAVQAGKLTSDQAAAAAKRHQDEYQKELNESRKSQESLSAGVIIGGTLMANAYMKAGQVVTDVFRRAAEELDKLKEKSRDAGDQYGELAQLQANTPALVEQVNQLVASGSVKSFAEGKAAVFAAESAGAQGSMPALAELAKFGVIQQMPEVIRSAEALRFTLGEQAGTPEEILAKSFASARSATTTAERVTIAASKSGTSGRELGINADESLAAAGILASAKGNADTAGERLAALFRGLKTQEGMQGKTLPQMIQAVQGMNLSFADRQKLLGGSEADEAFSVLQAKLPQLAKTIEAVTEARGAETLRTIAKDAAATPETALAANARAAQAKADLSGRQLGNVSLAVEASFNEKVADVRKQAQIEEAIWARRVANGEGEMAGARGTALMRAEIEVAALRTFEQFAKLIPGMQQHLAETAEASKETTKLMRDAAKANLGAAAALERAATRRDNLAAPRREAAAAHGGG